jgi:outer membrane immunogenic protein
MTKGLLLGALALVTMGITAPAVAADLPARTYTKAPDMVPVAYDWSGVYVGLNGGWGTANRCFDQTAPVVGAEGCHGTSGGFAGGQLGYRWQMSSWVFGFEGQGDWASLKGSNVSLITANTNRSRIDDFGLFTGQVGYAWNTVLGYVKGGGVVAADRFATYTIPGNVLVDRAGDTRWGGVVGAGLEYSFAPNWSAAVEYNHMFMGTKSVTAVTATGVFNATDRIRQDMDVVTARVNYRWGGPVVANY